MIRCHQRLYTVINVYIYMCVYACLPVYKCRCMILYKKRQSLRIIQIYVNDYFFLIHLLMNGTD